MQRNFRPISPTRAQHSLSLREGVPPRIAPVQEASMAKTYLEVATCVVVVTAAVLVAITRCTSCGLPLPR